MSGEPEPDGPPPFHHAFERFFFALRPDSETARAIDAFTARELPDGRRVPPGHQHVTLALTEDVAPPASDLIARLLEAGAQVEGECFDLVLDRISAHARTAALVPSLPPAPLLDLQRRIIAAMADQGARLRAGWRFSPHQTLCYRRGETFSHRVDGFVWSVRDFVLVRSLVGLGRHEMVHRWPLGQGMEG
jgi:2'-5' RNA ligase